MSDFNDSVQNQDDVETGMLKANFLVNDVLNKIRSKGSETVSFNIPAGTPLAYLIIQAAEILNKTVGDYSSEELIENSPASLPDSTALLVYNSKILDVRFMIEEIYNNEPLSLFSGLLTVIIAFEKSVAAIESKS